tara:strand:- start:1506 stop:2183 length:678 start_codon:yes stop_codon:yes gene_type:complete
MSLRSPVQLTNARGSVIVTQPAIEPVTAAEFKAQVRDDALTDAEALAWVTTARAYIEEMNNLAIITQTWRLALDRWPSGREKWWDGVRQGSRTELYGPSSFSDVPLPRYPLQSITSVTTFDTGNNATAVTVADVFNVDTYRTPGRLALRFGQTWPIALRETNAIVIDYAAGYGSAASDVPAPIKQGILLMAASLYENRGDGCSTVDAYAMSGARGMVEIYRAKAI